MNKNEVKCFFFFFNDTATTEIYTLSLHDALPISFSRRRPDLAPQTRIDIVMLAWLHQGVYGKMRSEEHTSELQSQSNLVCRLLLEKKKMAMISESRSHQNPRGEDNCLHAKPYFSH